MSTKDKDFYVWTMGQCIKTTYEWWGIDMMSMYDIIKKEFPNAAEAINEIYGELDESDFYKSQPVDVKKVQYVYEAIAKLIPEYEELSFNVRTKELDEEYKDLNLCSWKQYVKIKRIDLLMAMLLFTEEFILKNAKEAKLIFTENKLVVSGNFVSFIISKYKKHTWVTIIIKDVMVLDYMILNEK